MKKIIAIMAVLAFGLLLLPGCGEDPKKEAAPAAPAETAKPAAEEKIKVGTTAGADVKFLEKARDVAAKEGLTVEIIEFSDYVRPNLALAEKEIDLNSFQHLPYLENFNAERKLNLVSIGATYVAPIGLYSKKIKSLDELKEGDSIAIPNDPTNGGRSLLLLQKAGCIKVKPEAGLTATPFDIVENRLNLKIVEVDAAQTPRALDDVAVAAINNTYAIPAGLVPAKDAVYREATDSPYVNVIAARPEDKDNPLYHKFVKAYQSQEVADLLLQDSDIPAFEYKK